MKKLVLICFLSIVSVLNYLTFAQTQPCLWLENGNPNSIEELNTLQAPVYHHTDNYFVKVTNGDYPLDTKVSIDWEIWRDGVKLDGNLSQYADVYFEPFFTDLGNPAGGNWVATEKLRTGSGLTSNLPIPIRTDFPGAYPYMNNGRGYLNIGSQSYNYFYLHYLVYASNHNYLRMRVVWNQVGDYQIKLKLMSRINGTDIQNYYNHEGDQHLYYGGHQSIIDTIISTFTIEEVYRTNGYARLCGGDTLFIGNPVQALTSNPTWPNIDTIVRDINFYSLTDTLCFNKIDSILNLTLTVYPIPPVPVVSDKDICGTESVTLNVENAQENAQYNWYTDASLATIAYTGTTFTPENITVEGQNYYYYVVATSGNDCESDAAMVTVTSHTIPVVTLPDPTTVCPINHNAVVYAAVDSATFTAPLTYTWTGAIATVDGQADIAVTQECGGNIGTVYPYALIITDAWNCSSISVENSLIAIDTIAPIVTPMNIDLSVYGCGAAAIPTEFTTIEEVVTAGFSFTDNCDLNSSDFTVSLSDFQEVADCNYKIIRLYILKDHCGNEINFTHTITVEDTVVPSTNEQQLSYVAETEANCTYVIPRDLVNTISTDLDIHDNCTDAADLNVTLSIPAGTAIMVHTTVVASITDACGNVSTANVNITLPQPLSATIETLPATLAACYNTQFDFTVNTQNGTAPYTYSWSNSNITADLNTAYITPALDDIYTDQNFTYSVTVEDANNCSTSESVIVTVYAKPNFTLTNDHEICYEDNTDLTVTMISTGDFSYAWNTHETTATITVQPTETTTYNVTVINESTNCTNYKEVTVTVNPLPLFTIDATYPRTNCATPNGSVLFSTNEENVVFYINGVLQTSPYENLDTGVYAIYAHNLTTGCNSAVDSFRIEDARVNPIAVITSNISEFCFAESTPVTISLNSNQENAEYHYFYNNNESILSDNSNDYIITAVGTYVYSGYVVNTITNCQSSTVETTVVANPYPQNPTLTTNANNNTECAEKTITLTATASTPIGTIDTYQFDGQDASNLNTLDVVLPSTNNVTSQTYTVTITTDKGCTATASVTVTINPLPQVVSITQNDECPFHEITLTSEVVYGSTPYVYSWSSNVSSNGVTATVTNGTCGSNFEVSLAVTDINGCVSHSFAQQIIAKDEVSPVFTYVPSDTVINCQDVVTALQLTSQQVTYNDNCTSNNDIILNSLSQITEGNCANNYTITRTWIISDLCNNKDTAVQIVTVQDITAPVLISIPADYTVYDVCLADIPAFNLLDNALSASDNCSNEFLYSCVESIETDNSATPIVNYIHRVWSVTDQCNNISINTLTQTITVIDSAAPVFTFVPENVVVSCDNVPIASIENVSVTDNCDADPDVTVTDVRTDGDCPNSYIINRIWTATDNSNNVRTATQIITVQDITAPILSSTLPQSEIILTCSDEIPVAPTLTFVDNCTDVEDIDIVFVENSTQSTNSAECNYYNYTISRIWFATDNCGNTTDTIKQTIVVSDSEAPSFDPSTVPANITLNCNEAIPVANVQLVSFTDNCAGDHLTVNVSDASTQSLDASDAEYFNYTIKRTWTAKDPCNNMVSVDQIITIQDVSAPFVVASSIPDDITLTCGQNLPFADSTTVQFMDLCDNITSDDVTFNQVSTQTLSGCGQYSYTVTRTWFATDASNNVSDVVTQVVTFVDNTKPEPVLNTIPFSTITYNCQDVIPSANSSSVEFTDNCMGSVPASYVTFVEQSTQTSTGCQSKNYNIYRSWFAIDDCGNSSDTIRQTITVNDITAPTFTRPSDITIYRNSDCSFDASVSLVGDVTDEADNCSNDVLEATFTDDTIISSICSSNIAILRTWTLQDDCGNVAADQIQIIIVEDSIAPIFTVPATQAVCRNADGSYADLISPNLLGEPTALLDNCTAPSNLVVAFVDDLTNIGDNITDGFIIRTWTVTDECGNATVDDQRINIYHKPVVTIVGSEGICYNGSEILTANFANGDNGSYLWSTGETTQSITVDTQGVYSVTATLLTGCVASDDHQITEYTHPILVSTVPELECDGSSITLLADAMDDEGAPVSGVWNVISVPSNVTVSFSSNSHISYTTEPLSVNTHFVIEFTDDAHNCSYTHTTDSTIISSQPIIKTYLADNNGLRYESNTVEINSGSPVTFYVKVFKCSTLPNIRTTMEYSSYVKDNDNYLPISSLYNYLNSTFNKVEYSLDVNTPATIFNQVNLYRNDLAQSTFPFATANSQPGSAFTPNGGQTYFNWFFLHFFEDRYITITIDRFEDPGEYRFDYKLVSNYTQNYNGYVPCGSQYSINYTTGSPVGGTNFDQGVDSVDVLTRIKNFYIKVNESVDPVQPRPIQPSVEEVPAANLDIYPNPSQGEKVNMTFENVKGNAIVRVVALNGKVLGEHQINIIGSENESFELVLNQYVPGVYFIHVINNETIITKKLIIQ